MRSPTEVRTLAPRKKNLLNLYALLGKQRRLLVHCIRQCAESCVEKKPTNACCDKFVRFQRCNHADTREYLDKAVQNWNKTGESSDSVDNEERGFRDESVADSCIFVVCAHQPLKASLPLETKSTVVHVLVRMSWFASEVSRRVAASHTNQSQASPW